MKPTDKQVMLLKMCWDAVDRHCRRAYPPDCEECPWKLTDEDCLATEMIDVLGRNGIDWAEINFERMTALEMMAEEGRR